MQINRRKLELALSLSAILLILSVLLAQVVTQPLPQPAVASQLQLPVAQATNAAADEAGGPSADDPGTAPPWLAEPAQVDTTCSDVGSSSFYRPYFDVVTPNCAATDYFPPVGGLNLPFSNTTRLQFSVMAYRIKTQVNPQRRPWSPILTSTQTFEDVPHAANNQGNWQEIETAVYYGVLQGFVCGSGPAGPCVAPANRPYFLPDRLIRRNEMAKITRRTLNMAAVRPSTPSFNDVPLTNQFSPEIEAARYYAIMFGYPQASQCGVVAVPCFLPTNPTIRGDAAIVGTRMIDYVISNDTFELHCRVIGTLAPVPCTANVTIGYVDQAGNPQSQHIDGPLTGADIAAPPNGELYLRGSQAGGTASWRSTRVVLTAAGYTYAGQAATNDLHEDTGGGELAWQAISGDIPPGSHTLTVYFLPLPTATATTVPATDTPTPDLTGTAVASVTACAALQSCTATPEPTGTATDTATPTATATASNTATPTNTATSTATASPIPTSTPNPSHQISGWVRDEQGQGVNAAAVQLYELLKNNVGVYRGGLLAETTTASDGLWGFSQSQLAAAEKQAEAKDGVAPGQWVGYSVVQQPAPASYSWLRVDSIADPNPHVIIGDHEIQWQSLPLLSIGHTTFVLTAPTPTATHTPTATATNTSTSTATPTNTNTPAATYTPRLTYTMPPTLTPRNTLTPRGTPPANPTWTATVTETPIPTETVEPSATGTPPYPTEPPLPTRPPLPTNTEYPTQPPYDCGNAPCTATPTVTPADCGSSTCTPTATAQATNTATATPNATETCIAAGNCAGGTPTATPNATQTCIAAGNCAGGTATATPNATGTCIAAGNCAGGTPTATPPGGNYSDHLSGLVQQQNGQPVANAHLLIFAVFSGQASPTLTSLDSSSTGAWQFDIPRPQPPTGLSFDGYQVFLQPSSTLAPFSIVLSDSTASEIGNNHNMVEYRPTSFGQSYNSLGKTLFIVAYANATPNATQTCIAAGNCAGGTPTATPNATQTCIAAGNCSGTATVPAPNLTATCQANPACSGTATSVPPTSTPTPNLTATAIVATQTSIAGTLTAIASLPTSTAPCTLCTQVVGTATAIAATQTAVARTMTASVPTVSSTATARPGQAADLLGGTVQKDMGSGVGGPALQGMSVRLDLITVQGSSASYQEVESATSDGAGRFTLTHVREQVTTQAASSSSFGGYRVRLELPGGQMTATNLILLDPGDPGQNIRSARLSNVAAAWAIPATAASYQRPLALSFIVAQSVSPTVASGSPTSSPVASSPVASSGTAASNSPTAQAGAATHTPVIALAVTPDLLNDPSKTYRLGPDTGGFDPTFGAALVVLLASMLLLGSGGFASFLLGLVRRK